MLGQAQFRLVKIQHHLVNTVIRIPIQAVTEKENIIIKKDISMITMSPIEVVILIVIKDHTMIVKRDLDLVVNMMI